MVKRKELGDVVMGGTKPEESDSDEDMDMVNVEFEWFDPQPIDFHGLKNLLRQLFDNDAQIFDMSALADLILSQPTLGSTVKVDGHESDPYAFLSILNLQEHKDKPVVQDLINYLKTKSASNPSLSAASQLLSQTSIPPIGLILTERLINMPSEIVPPMYNMLQEEIAWAVEDKEPYTFSHYLVLSKNYEEVESKLDQEESRPQKKRRRVSDEGHSDSKRAFQELGIRTKGSLILIEAAKFEPMVKALTQYMS
ncbi:BCP1 family [Penicillium expansum]|nr:BCP1 family [Penicillium expansum]